VAEARICLLSLDEKHSYDRRLIAQKRALEPRPLPVTLESISPDAIPMRPQEHLRSPKLLADAMPQPSARDARLTDTSAIGTAFSTWISWTVAVAAMVGGAALIGLLTPLL
jgi:hypothetical protein